MCVVWQNFDCRTKRKSQEATSARKRRDHGAILFGWGDSLLRDMLDAGVFDCLNSEFDDIQVSVLCCVLKNEHVIGNKITVIIINLTSAAPLLHS